MDSIIALPESATWCRACTTVAEMEWERTDEIQANEQLWCISLQPPQQRCTVHPSSSCADALARPENVICSQK